MTVGSRVLGLRSTGNTSTTGVSNATSPSRTRLTTAQAVNILVTDAIPNLVAGVTGIRLARSAYPTHVSRTRSPPRVSSTAPDRSRDSPHELSVWASDSSRSASVGIP